MFNKEVLFTEGNWQVVRSIHEPGYNFSGSFRSSVNPDVTPPYYEHLCHVDREARRGWLWYIPSYRDLDVRTVCKLCNQSPTNGMVAMMKFLAHDERLAD